MIRTILQDGHPMLRQIAEPVEIFDAALECLAADMIETMRAAKGIGLAAPQVGASLRLIVACVHGGQFTLVNPEIKQKSGEQRSTEGCLSVPRTQWGKVVLRSAFMRIEYQDLAGETKHLRARKALAAVVQHEIDHLDGILFTTRWREQQQIKAVQR